MIDRLSKRILNWLIRTEVVKSESYDVYLFGLHQGMISLINYITTLIIALAFHNLLEGIIFMIVYQPLRSYVGGFHARTELGCYILSSILSCSVLMVCKVFQFNLRSFFIFIIAVLVLWFVAPVEDSNKPLDQVEKYVYAKRSKIILSMELIAIGLSYKIHLYHITGVMIITLITLSIMVVIGSIRNRYVKYHFEGSVLEHK